MWTDIDQSLMIFYIILTIWIVYAFLRQANLMGADWMVIYGFLKSMDECNRWLARQVQIYLHLSKSVFLCLSSGVHWQFLNAQLKLTEDLSTSFIYIKRTHTYSIPIKKQNDIWIKSAAITRLQK